MTLISLLIVMLLERVTQKNARWHITRFAQSYLSKLQKHNSVDEDSAIIRLLLILMLPGIFLYALLILLDVTMLTLVVHIALLYVCLGCPITRFHYKQYLQAGARKDFEACSLHSEAFGNEKGDLTTVGKQVVYINYKNYAALIVVYTVLGVFGLLSYALAKSFEEFYSHDESETAKRLRKVLFYIDWLPVRIVSFGFLVVGHFTNALPIWINSFFDFTTPTKTILTNIAKDAEDISADVSDCVEEPCVLVRLAKRNIIFMLVTISLLTMVGMVS